MLLPWLGPCCIASRHWRDMAAFMSCAWRSHPRTWLCGRPGCCCGCCTIAAALLAIWRCCCFSASTNAAIAPFRPPSSVLRIRSCACRAGVGSGGDGGEDGER